MISHPIRYMIFLGLICLFGCERTPETSQETLTEQEPEQFERPIAPAEVTVPKGMVYIPATTYTRGNERELGTRSRYPEEQPEHKVFIDAFLVDETEVTNAQYSQFTEATGYLTFAEKGLSSEDFPNAPKDQLVAGAMVFTPPPSQPELWGADATSSWWAFVPGANWRHPEGPKSSIEDKMNHPVVCLNHDDIIAYTEWAGKRLPTEAEWEAAARAGMERKLFTWGDTPLPNGKWMGNTYQGTFPTENTTLDQYVGTAPVRSFPPNRYGLYDMAGNVWEHVSDYYRPDTYEALTQEITKNPTGPTQPIDMVMSQKIGQANSAECGASIFHDLGILYTMKGGSFLCHHSYCLRYRPAARHFAEGLTPTNHSGFRCAQSIE